MCSYDKLMISLENAIEVDFGRRVWVDKYLPYAIVIDVDALVDSEGNVMIGSMMKHRCRRTRLPRGTNNFSVDVWTLIDGWRLFQCIVSNWSHCSCFSYNCTQFRRCKWYCKPFNSRICLRKTCQCTLLATLFSLCSSETARGLAAIAWQRLERWMLVSSSNLGQLQIPVMRKEELEYYRVENFCCPSGDWDYIWNDPSVWRFEV